MIFLSGVFFPMQDLPGWMSVIVKINPASYGIATIREVVLGASPDSPFNIILFGHIMTIRDNIAVLAVFGFIMIILAMWSFGRQD